MVVIMPSMVALLQSVTWFGHTRLTWLLQPNVCLQGDAKKHSCYNACTVKNKVGIAHHMWCASFVPASTPIRV